MITGKNYNNNFEDFLNNIHNIEKRTKRTKNKVRALHLVGLKSPLLAEKYANMYNMSTADILEAFDDCDDDMTAYIVKISDKYYPVSFSALKSLESRASIFGAALSKLKPEQYTRIINTCLKTADKKEKSTIVLVDDVVNAFLSDDYKIIKADEIFKKADKALKSFSARFVNGFIDRELFLGNFKLSESVLKGYEDIVPEEYIPCVTIQTSNIGLSGANIYPTLENKNKNFKIKIGESLNLPHKGGANIEEFEKNMKQIFALYKKSLEHISSLKEIDIDFPVETFISVSKKLKLPQKYTCLVAQDINTEYPQTAYDLYLAMNDVLFYAKDDNKSEKAMMQLSENIARCLQIDWKEFDFPVNI